MDTSSSAIWASVHTEEKNHSAIAHWHLAFAALGIHHTKNPAYIVQHTFQSTWHFLQLWGVFHHTGIPHSPTDIVMRAHSTLKCVLEKQKEGETPHSRVTKALYTFNHLTVLSFSKFNS